MVMNLYILLTVSLPEAFFNLIIILLFAGEKDRLKINKSNIIRFSISLTGMLVASCIIRPLVPNVVVNTALHTLSYILILTIMYKMNLFNTLFSIIFALLIFSTVENLYLPFIIAYVAKGMESFARNYYLYPAYAIPSRIVQLIIIYFLWKHEILLVTRIDRQFHRIFVTSMTILLFVEYFLGYIFSSCFGNITFIQQITFSIALISAVIIFNLLVFKFIYIAVSGIIIKGYKQYAEFEDDVKFVFGKIQTMLEDNKIHEAINLIKELEGKA